jgi:integrase
MTMPRQAKPWFRSNQGTWYGTVDGRKTNLRVRGRENEAAAWIAWQQLRNGGPPPTVQPAPAAPTAPAAQVVTVGNVVRDFLRDAAGRVEADTLELYRLFLTPFAKLHGRLPAASLTCPAAEQYSRRPTWNDSTRSAFLAVLARAFRHAERARLIDRTPLIGLRRPPIASRAADAMVTRADHEKLIAVVSTPFRRFLGFLFLVGCRPAEAAQLAAGDVNWDDGTAIVRNHKTRRKGKRRVLYLTPAAVADLRELANRYPSGPLFRNRVGKPWTRATIGMAMRKARKLVGLPGKIVYGYRHGFATDALAAGVPDAHVAELLGHSSTAMLHKHYSHLATRVKVLTEAVRVVR